MKKFNIKLDLKTIPSSINFQLGCELKQLLPVKQLENLSDLIRNNNYKHKLV